VSARTDTLRQVVAREKHSDKFESVMLKSVAVVCFTASLLFSANGFAAEPTNHAATLAPFLNQDTFAVAYADIASLDLPKDRETILGPQMLMIMQSLPSEVQAQIFIADMAQTFAMRFRDAGGQGFYMLAGLGDVHIGGGPVLIATAQAGRCPEEVRQFFGVTIQEMAENPSYRTVHPFIKQLDVQLKGGAVLVGMKDTVARYANMKSAVRNDLTSPLVRMASEGAIASAVFCPGPDFRRVVRELWPELPGALAPLKGELADHWLHLEAAIHSPPNLNPRIALYSSNSDAAKTFAELWEQLPTAVTQFGGNEKSVAQAKGLAQLMVTALQAKVDGTRVTIDFPKDQDRLLNLHKLFGTAINTANESSNRRETLTRFHNISLAILNYESAKRHLPAAAIYDKEGRPLLSWRVAVLPYLEKGELYKQFHLDEPWDSPHNKTLIDKMPGEYMGVGSQYDQLNREGKTTCQVPVGPKTVFYNKEGAKYRDISDGTSKTILLIEVEPKRAVPWTKPEDWEVDLEHPRRGVERSDRNQFTAAWCDGSVQLVPVSADEAQLRALLTRAGGEVVEPHF
jgi:hypothetical protein